MAPIQETPPRFGKISTAKTRSGLGKQALYDLAGTHRGLFRKYNSATLVDLDMLDTILADLPEAEIKPPAPRKQQTI